MVKIRFTRDTKRSEGKQLFRAGQEAEVSTSSARHWFSRNAAVPVRPAITVKATEQQTAEIANAQVDNSAPDGGSSGDGAKPDAGASTVGAPSGRGGNRSK
jgi:hypothetical protein